MTIQEKYQHNFCQETISMFTGMQVSFMTLAKRLYEIRDKRLYEAGWSSFQDYCLEMSEMSISTVSRLVNVYQKFVLEGGVSEEDIAEAGWSKVAAALPIMKNPKDAKRWIEKAKQLSKIDFVREVKEKQTGIEMADCEHEDTYTVTICRSCGERRQTDETGKPL